MKMTRAELTSKLQLECARQFGKIHRELDRMLQVEQARIAEEVSDAFDANADIAVADDTGPGDGARAALLH